jgi:trimeric autotransporter adhesin
VTGKITAGTKDFKIDDPIDPGNKYLYHASIESSEMTNIYSGNISLDGKGEAMVRLPEWFEALNGDFRYQLTGVGGFAPVYISEEIHDNCFKIAGGRSGMKVSWQVTGVRHDAWARAHRIKVEEDKATDERGYYLHPKEYGQPEEKGIQYAHKLPTVPASPGQKGVALAAALAEESK